MRERAMHRMMVAIFPLPAHETRRLIAAIPQMQSRVQKIPFPKLWDGLARTKYYASTAADSKRMEIGPREV